MTPDRAGADPSTRREQPSDDLSDWAVIGIIVLGSSLMMWVPLLF